MAEQGRGEAPAEPLAVGVLVGSSRLCLLYSLPSNVAWRGTGIRRYRGTLRNSPPRSFSLGTLDRMPSLLGSISAPGPLLVVER